MLELSGKRKTEEDREAGHGSIVAVLLLLRYSPSEGREVSDYAKDSCADKYGPGPDDETIYQDPAGLPRFLEVAHIIGLGRLSLIPGQRMFPRWREDLEPRYCLDQHSIQQMQLVGSLQLFCFLGMPSSEISEGVRPAGYAPNWFRNVVGPLVDLLYELSYGLSLP